MNISSEELNNVLKEVRHIQIRTGKVVSDVLAGEYHSLFKGRGMEFEDVREYFPGDDVRNIDWNVTARMNHPYVKNFREERELTVMLIVDISASSGFGSIGFSKANIIAKICATIAFSAIKNNDNVELILFSDKIEKYIPANKGSNHVLRIIRELLVSAKILENAKSRSATDINIALEHLNRHRRKRGVCFIVSDFISKDFEKDLRLAAKRHDMIAIAVSDPRELDIPDVGLVELEDSETGEIIFVDTSSTDFRNQFIESVENESDERSTFFKSLGIDLLEINTGEPFEHSLVNFFKSRSKRR
jgi:uncharacterized protein (DUF58 family)